MRLVHHRTKVYILLSLTNNRKRWYRLAVLSLTNIPSFFFAAATGKGYTIKTLSYLFYGAHNFIKPLKI